MSSQDASRRKFALEILVKATSGAAAVVSLLNILHKKQSLRALCKRFNMTSSGYLSDVLKGKRILHKKYLHAVAKTFHLEGIEERYLLKMLEIDRCSDPSKRALITSEMQALRKMLLVKTIQLSEVADIVFFALEVFNALGLFNNRATLAQLRKLYPRERHHEIDRSLSFLLKQEVVVSEGQHFVLAGREIQFRTPGLEVNYAQLMQKALEESLSSIETWYHLREKSHYESTVLSIHSKNLPAKITKLREQLQEIYSSLEESPADTMLRVNIQCFPTAIKRTKSDS